MLQLKLIDFAKGVHISEKYKFYLSTFNWSREQITDYQNQRLQDLIDHAYTNVPYYRNLMINNNVSPEDIKNIDDLQKIPILDRESIRQNGKDLKNKNAKRKDLHKGTSSGTTGIPITYYQDANSLSAGDAANYALWSMSGWKPGQKNVHIWGNASSIQRWKSWRSRLKTNLLNQLNVPSVLIDEEDLERIAEQIIRFKPKSIEGYPSAIYSLAKYFVQKNLKLKELLQVLTTAENLESYQREIIEEAFAPTGDLYGCGEVKGIASRPIDEDKYYIFEPHVIIEAVDSGLEGMKDILVTDLDNFLMPMIRYKVGDLIDNLYPSDPNARFRFIYFKKIIGRNADIIQLPNGMRFHPINIFGGTLFRKFPEISKHRVIWNGVSLKIIFEIKENFNDAILKQQIGDVLAKYDVPFTLEYTTRLFPSSNGKYKYVEIIK